MSFNPEEIKQGNEIIAKALGWFQEEGQDGTWFKIFGNRIVVAYSIHNNYPHKDLPFHRDWNALYEIIEVIESLDQGEAYDCGLSHMYTIETTRNGSTAYRNYRTREHNGIICRRNTRDNRIENTWYVVVEFIKWYQKENNISNG
jgi:hypothetical protein